MILAIRNKVRETNITWKYQHVRGHQDDHVYYENLDRMSQLNVLMDEGAKVYLVERHVRQQDQQQHQQRIAGEPYGGHSGF